MHHRCGSSVRVLRAVLHEPDRRQAGAAASLPSAALARCRRSGRRLPKLRSDRWCHQAVAARASLALADAGTPGPVAPTGPSAPGRFDRPPGRRLPPGDLRERRDNGGRRSRRRRAAFARDPPPTLLATAGTVVIGRAAKERPAVSRDDRARVAAVRGDLRGIPLDRHVSPTFSVRLVHPLRASALGLASSMFHVVTFRPRRTST